MIAYLKLLQLLYKEIYNGIDILYYEREGVIKWDFIVEPNKNINNILLNFIACEYGPIACGALFVLIFSIIKSFLL